MKKKPMKTKESSRPPVPDPGFYGAQVGSPQNVQFAKGSELNYLKPSQVRAEELKKLYRETPNESPAKMTNFARFNGEGTFNFRNRKTDITPLSKPGI
jgi:hypothetical protein